MVSEEKDEFLELMKRFEEVSIKDKRLALKKNHGHRIIVKDSAKGYVFGEVRYVKRSETFYNIKRGTREEMKLCYSNLEKIFVNNKEH